MSAREKHAKINAKLMYSAYFQLFIGLLVLVGSLIDSTNQIEAILNKK